MCTVREAPQIVLPQQADAEGTEFAEHPFFEAPSLRKANGRYYLIYSSTQNHELCYAVADKPRAFTITAEPLFLTAILGWMAARCPAIIPVPTMAVLWRSTVSGMCSTTVRPTARPIPARLR